MVWSGGFVTASRCSRVRRDLPYSTMTRYLTRGRCSGCKRAVYAVITSHPDAEDGVDFRT